MTSFVTLLKPLTLRTMGYSFAQNERVPVPYSVAKALENNERFKVELDTTKAPTAKDRPGVDETGRPFDRKARLAAIRLATDKLDVDDDSNFTASGMPDARKLTQILGWQVTSQERDDALREAPRTGAAIPDEEVVAALEPPVVEQPVAAEPPEAAGNAADVEPGSDDTKQEASTEEVEDLPEEATDLDPPEDENQEEVKDAPARPKPKKPFLGKGGSGKITLTPKVDPVEKAEEV